MARADLLNSPGVNQSQEVEFNPEEHQQSPERALTLAIRRLRVGARVRMPDGTVVKSITMQGSFGPERRFAVIPPEESSTPLDRHRVLALGRGAHRTASQAAQAVLKKESN